MYETYYNQSTQINDLNETEVYDNPELETTYRHQKLQAIMNGDRVWVRRTFNPSKPEIYDYFDSHKYIGSTISVAGGYRVHATRELNIGFYELTDQPLNLDHAQTLLFGHSQRDQLVI